MKYISYKITPLQPLVINELSSKAKTQRTLNYIPGSSVRGEFVRVLLKSTLSRHCRLDPQSKEQPKEGEAIDQSSDILNEILDKVVFTNAYPADCIPMPRCFQADKHAIRKNEISKVVNTLNFDFEAASEQNPGAKTEQNEAIANKYPYLKMPDFKPVKVEKSQVRRIALNVALNNASKQENTIFYTESIDAEQDGFSGYQGYIQFEDSLEQVVSAACGAIRLPSFGAAQNSGYGGCEISFEAAIDTPPLPTGLSNRGDSDNKLIIYCATDVISYSSEGRCLARIDEQLLADKLGIVDVRFDKAILTQKTISGFNKKMRAAYPRETAIAAGSVLKYTYSGSIDCKKIDALEDCGIGRRRSEGFGKIVINPDFLYDEELQLGGDAQ